MKKTNIITLGGVLAAVSVVLMFLTNFIPIAQMALPAIAGVLLITMVLEAGSGWAFGVYVVVSALSLLLLGDKTPAIYYIFFFGHYPIVKNYIERLKNKPLQWLVKLAACNLCGAAVYLITTFVMGLPLDLPIKGVYVIPAAVLAVNLVFVIYDFAVSRLIVLYVYRLRKMLFHK